MNEYKIIYEYNFYSVFLIQDGYDILVKEYDDISEVEAYVVLKNGIISEYYDRTKNA